MNAWLIEEDSEAGPNGRWWRGGNKWNADNFSADANEAIRFARKEDAEKVIRTTLADEAYRLVATEHGWS